MQATTREGQGEPGAALPKEHRCSQRRGMDFMKLMSSPLKVYPSDDVGEFWVEFHGPPDTPYEEGTWALHVQLPNEYPFKSPSIGFANRVMHPNVDLESGSVCLDVINKRWTPMYQLRDIFDTFLPQLMRYPNVADPLNPSAGALFVEDPNRYTAMVQTYVRQYATREMAMQAIPLPFTPQFEPSGVSEEPSTAVGDAVATDVHETEDVRLPQNQSPDDDLFEGVESYEPEEIEL